MRSAPITRRTLLKGLGTITVGLPFLEEMRAATPARAAAAAVPVRAFNVFFGLGVPTPLQEEGFAGVMEPLKELADKLLILRHVDHVRGDQPGINAHYDGSTAAFTAEPPNGTARAGGPSIDQVVRATHHPDGLPPDMVPTLVAGTFFRRDRVSRYTKSFALDGTVAATMQEAPRDVFERVFGSVPGTDETDPRRMRIKRSVLDSTMDQYHFYTGPNSPLGAASRTRVAEHLDRIREYEKRAFAMESRKFKAPRRPGESQLPHGGTADPGGEGIDITLEDLTTEWRLMADLYALAILTDRVRFGSINFLAAGERIRLKGDYLFNGEKRFHFDDRAQRNSGGSNGCSHEWWHAFREDQPNAQLRAHAHMKLREVAYFLKRLDDPEFHDPNGKSVLENSMITISTESGDGRHNDPKRELSGIFHAITGANGRFKTGGIMDVKAEGIDVYNTMLGAMGCKRRLGPEQREGKRVDKILV